jgi:hypothetical protein
MSSSRGLGLERWCASLSVRRELRPKHLRLFGWLGRRPARAALTLACFLRGHGKIPA